MATYRKRHLIVIEPYEPGDGTLFTSGDHAVVICKDLDFPELARQNRRLGARVFLVPAWDFGADGWLHSRMAIVRGVENGAPGGAVARGGALTVSDAWGRVLTEARTTGGDGSVSTVADLTVATRGDALPPVRCRGSRGCASRAWAGWSSSG